MRKLIDDLTTISEARKPASKDILANNMMKEIGWAIGSASAKSGYGEMIGRWPDHAKNWKELAAVVKKIANNAQED